MIFNACAMVPDTTSTRTEALAELSGKDSCRAAVGRGFCWSYGGETYCARTKISWTYKVPAVRVQGSEAWYKQVRDPVPVLRYFLRISLCLC